jgi:serine/threonine protein kinase
MHHGPFSKTQVTRVILHVLRGLAYLNLHGIIHRDLKPANILVGTRSDTFKLCDWISEAEWRRRCFERASW